MRHNSYCGVVIPLYFFPPSPRTLNSALPNLLLLSLINPLSFLFGIYQRLIIDFDFMDFSLFPSGPPLCVLDGPVLEAFLVKVVKAKLELNPLLAPPPDDTERPYLKWNMLFPTAQCQKSDDPAIRSWSSGRGAPATWPRIKSLRLISRSFPWDIQVTATDPEDGVTCGDVIDAIHEFMYGRVSSSQLKNATPEHTRVISQAYHHNRSTAYGVPGGKLMNTLLRCDWLGQHTMFGGIVENKRLVKDLCGGSEFPCTFELKCVQRYPMTAEEIREHEAREREAEAQQQRSRRRHSRATSRATSRASTRPPSRAPSRNGDDAEEEEEESEELV